MTTTIRDLKNALGTGLGSRKNKYLLEISFADIDSARLNILCKTASLPQRTIEPVSAWCHGRKYNMRSETNYGGNYELTIVDDSDLTFRQFFDAWMKQIDDSSKIEQGSFAYSEDTSLAGKIKKLTNKVKEVREFVSNPLGDVKAQVKDFTNMFKNTLVASYYGTYSASYQTDVRIWQLDATGSKVYGYVLQNAFPVGIGEVTYDDSETDSLVEYNVTFAFSEFEPA